MMIKRVRMLGIVAVILTAVICMSIILFTLFSGGVVAEAETTEQTTEQTRPVKAAAEDSQALESEIVSESDTTAMPETADSADGAETAYEELIVETDPQMYTYEQMVLDLEGMKLQYPELANLDSIGDTPDGRQIWHLVIGNQAADRHVLVTASIHAREYITTQLAMKQAAEFLRKSEDYQSVLENTAIHVVPMINPDGVSISQMGLEGCKLEETRQRILEIGAMDGTEDWSSYLRRWKSNAQGVDLNRNFDALWEQYDDGLGHPSADHYKGTAIGCAPEAAALIQLTEKYPFDRTISYHTQGSVIYWYFGQSGDLKADTEAFAKRVSETTGYPMNANYEKLDPAGYKDWAIHRRGIPSLTIEVGNETSPVPPAQFSAIWQANKGVWDVMLEQ